MLFREMALSGISPPPELRDGKTLAWWDWQRGTTIDTSNYVSSWADRLNGVALVQASAGAQPLKGDGIVFDGSGDFISIASITLAEPYTIYVAVKQLTWVDNKMIFILNSSLQWYQRGTFQELRQFAGVTPKANLTSVIGAKEVHTVLFNGAGSSNQVNNRTKVTGSSGTNTPSYFSIGGTLAGSALANIAVYDVIIRTQSDNDAVQAKIKKYLAQKNRIIL